MRCKVNRAGALERLFQKSYQKIDLLIEAKKSRRQCLRKLKGIDGGYRGTYRNFKTEVLAFWGKYNIKPKKMWYDFYCRLEGTYNPFYIPDDLYWQVIYPAFNKVSFRRAYTNKCLYDILFPYFNKPKTILYNVNGIYFKGQKEIICFDKAVKILSQSGPCIIKPALYSGGGKDICFYTAGGNTVNGIGDATALLKSYGSDFIIQQPVEQHKALSAIHKESVNTIRVISYLFDGKVHISSAILRMGAHGSKTDNFSAGGVACPIRSDGKLSALGVDSEMKRLHKHPSGLVFNGIEIPGYDKVLKLVKKHT